MIKFANNIFIVLLVGLTIITSCKKDDSAEKQAEIDEQIIQDYLADHNIDATRDDSGLYYKITDEGTGDHPTIYSTVEVIYKGYLLDGSIFDQTTTGPAVLHLQNLIEGWQIGVPLLKEGGSGTFYIPSGLGYGPTGSSSIPSNSVIIFEIDLVTVL